MRHLLAVLSLVVVVGLATFAGPRFLSSVFWLPAQQAVDLVVRGEPLNEVSLFRAADAIELSVQFNRDRRALSELGIIEYRLGTQHSDTNPERASRLAESLSFFEESLALNLVQPATWLAVAQIKVDQGRLQEAGEAFDWSIRTAHYLRHQVRIRALLALQLWDYIEEETRRRSTVTIVDTLAREPDLVAAYAATVEAEEDVRERLRALEPDGVLIAAQFSAAVRRFEQQERVRMAAEEEFSAMFRRLVASSMLVTAAVPSYAEAMTVREYLTIIQGDDPERVPESVDVYLRAVLDGLLVLGYFNREDGVALFCLPQREIVNVDVASFRVNLDAMLLQLESEMPNFDSLARTRSVGLAALELLTITYPCEE